MNDPKTKRRKLSFFKISKQYYDLNIVPQCAECRYQQIQIAYFLSSNCFLHIFCRNQIKFLWFDKIPCNKISLIQFNISQLPVRCISNLAAILSREVLQVSLSGSSNCKIRWDLIIFTAISMQTNYNYFISFQEESYSACFWLTVIT